MVEIVVDAHDDGTRAEARVVVPDGGTPEPGGQLRGAGQSHHRAGEAVGQEIEDEFAVSRALWDLAHAMWRTAVADLEAVPSGSPAR